MTVRVGVLPLYRAGVAADIGLDDATLAERWAEARAEAERAGRDASALELSTTAPISSVDAGTDERLAATEPGWVADELASAAARLDIGGGPR
jgi:hypothetical protein